MHRLFRQNVEKIAKKIVFLWNFLEKHSITAVQQGETSMMNENINNSKPLTWETEDLTKTFVHVCLKCRINLKLKL